MERLLVLGILKTEKSRVRDRFISYSKIVQPKCRPEGKLNNVDKQKD
jgi:hypothetical protein